MELSTENVAIVSLLGGVVWFLLDLYSAYQSTRSNNIQERQLAAFEEANELTRQQAMTGGRVMLHRPMPVPVRSVARQFPLWRVLPPIALFLLALGVSGYDLYERHSMNAETADLRLAPLAAGSRFLSDLQPDTKETVWFFCYPFDPMSCDIARQYRDRFQGQWTSGYVKYAPAEDPDFTGINICTKNELKPAPGATALIRELSAFGLKPQLRTAADLKSNEFEVWIGWETINANSN